MLECLLALAMLCGDPPESVDPSCFVAAPALRVLAVEWELLDPREAHYVLTRPEDLAADVRMLRLRWQELADAPPLADVGRFPPRPVVSDMLAFNRAYRQHLENRQSVDLARWWDLREAIQETDRLYQVWDTVRDARCEYYYVTVRRQALERLRETLGPENYYAANLPPHVPVRFFSRID